MPSDSAVGKGTAGKLSASSTGLQGASSCILTPPLVTARDACLQGLRAGPRLPAPGIRGYRARTVPDRISGLFGFLVPATGTATLSPLRMILGKYPNTSVLDISE